MSIVYLGMKNVYSKSHLPGNNILLTIPGITKRINGVNFKKEAATHASLLCAMLLAERLRWTIIYKNTQISHWWI